MIFWQPGDLNLARRRASWAWLLIPSLQRTERRTWPITTQAQAPWGLPKASLMPVWSLSVPAHDSTLLICKTWKGWTLILRWNWKTWSCTYCKQYGQLQVPHLRRTPPNWPSVHRKGTTQLSFSSCPRHNHDLGIRNATAKPWLRVRLVLTS